MVSRHTAHALIFGALLLNPTPASAQRVLQESTRQWRNAAIVTLTPVQRWCVDPDAPGCDFKRPASVRALPDGGILMADARGPLHRFGANGQFVGPLGRSGKGPGEYGFVVDAQMASNGYVTWFDNTQMRIATVRLDGTAGPITRVMPPYTMAAMFLVDTQLVVLDVPAAPTLGAIVAASYRTVPTSGLPKRFATVQTPSTFTPGSDMRPLSGPFAPRVLGDVGLEGDVAHSNGTRYEVQFFPRVGARWTLTVDAPARPVLAAERDSAITAIVKRFRVANVNSLPPTVREAYAAAPAAHAPLVTMKVLRDGTLWVRPVADAGSTIARWDIFARDGRRIGAARLPIASRVWDGTRNWILVDELNADDVPTIVRYRIGT
jgi:hypothetical protein